MIHQPILHQPAAPLPLHDHARLLVRTRDAGGREPHEANWVVFQEAEQKKCRTKGPGLHPETSPGISFPHGGQGAARGLLLFQQEEGVGNVSTRGQGRRQGHTSAADWLETPSGVRGVSRYPSPWGPGFAPRANKCCSNSSPGGNEGEMSDPWGQCSTVPDLRHADECA